MPIKIIRRLAVDNINLDRGKTPIISTSQIITRQEYEALMSEISQGALAESLSPAQDVSDVAETVNRLEFDLMILVGLILVVVMFMLNT
jgi:hypothetical protein